MTIEQHYADIAPRLTNWLVSTGSSYHDACDLVQAVFLKLWNMKDDLLESDSAVSGLAFTMAKNLRKNAARDNSHIVFKEEITEDDAGAIQTRVMPSDAKYLRHRLNQAFAKLPPPLREAYTLFQIGELSVREIAHELGISEALVKVRIHRAKEKLKEILADLVTF